MSKLIEISKDLITKAKQRSSEHELRSSNDSDSNSESVLLASQQGNYPGFDDDDAFLLNFFGNQMPKDIILLSQNYSKASSSNGNGPPVASTRGASPVLFNSDAPSARVTRKAAATATSNSSR